MERMTRTGAGVFLALLVAGFATPVWAQDADGGTQQRIVIVPAPTPDAQAPGEPQRRIVIVPNDQQSAPAQEPQRRIVIVPNTPDSSAQPSDGTQPQQRIVIVPNPDAAPADQGTATQPNAATPDTTGTAQASPPPDSTGAVSPNATATAPSQDTATAPLEGTTPNDANSGDGMRTVTATPDVPQAQGTDAAVSVGAQTSGSAPIAAAPVAAPEDPHARIGPFLSGPGSLTFILHHTLMGAAGGFATQGISNNFSSDTGGKEAILAGTLVGAGVGFGTSAWWQFNHWIGKPTANFGIVNSLSGGMFLTGLLDLTTDDPTALAWSSFLGSELGAWLTAGIGGGDMPVESGLMIASGEGWGAIYGSLLMAIVRFSGSSLRTESAIDTFFIAQGAGAILSAFMLGHFHPSARQILRADVSGAVVGGAVLLISALVLGHLDSPTPYALSMASSATTMALVSIFWDESAEPGRSGSGPAQYRSEWW